MFDQFHRFSSLPYSFASYFVNFIPNVKSIVHLSDFMHISLIGHLYKLMDKVIATRLGKVMKNLGFPNQNAFLKRRLLVGGVMEVNEVIDMAKKTRNPFLYFKVYFEKSYDLVSWDFLDYMLVRFWFNVKWRSWIRTCVFSRYITMLVNVFPTQEVIIQRILKQGGPLDPFIFLLVIGGLSGSISRVVELVLLLDVG